MNSLFAEFRERADFRLVYIAEAHATDEWPIASGRFTADGQAVCLTQPRSADERRAALLLLCTWVNYVLGGISGAATASLDDWHWSLTPVAVLYAIGMASMQIEMPKKTNQTKSKPAAVTVAATVPGTVLPPERWQERFRGRDVPGTWPRECPEAPRGRRRPRGPERKSADEGRAC